MNGIPSNRALLFLVPLYMVYPVLLLYMSVCNPVFKTLHVDAFFCFYFRWWLTLAQWQLNLDNDIVLRLWFWLSRTFAAILDKKCRRKRTKSMVPPLLKTIETVSQRLQCLLLLLLDEIVCLYDSYRAIYIYRNNNNNHHHHNCYSFFCANV